MEKYMRKVIQIKGANGSGKTTIARQLIGLSNNVIPLHDTDNRFRFIGRKPFAMYLADLDWIVVGNYPEGGLSGGCDGLPDVATMKAVIAYLVIAYPTAWILFEGAMISSTMTLYYFIRDLALTDKTFEPVAVLLRASVEGCIKRLEKRKGVELTETSFTRVADKCKAILRQDALYERTHLRHIDVDAVEECDMVYDFLVTVEWHYDKG
jgi:cytidylate kinase